MRQWENTRTCRAIFGRRHDRWRAAVLFGRDHSACMTARRPARSGQFFRHLFPLASSVRMTRASRAGATRFAPAGVVNSRDGSFGNASIFSAARRTSSSRSVLSQRMLSMNADAGSRDPVATFGMARKKSRNSILLSFTEALKEPRRRQARRVIATYAHLLADRDAPNDDNHH